VPEKLPRDVLVPSLLPVLRELVPPLLETDHLRLVVVELRLELPQLRVRLVHFLLEKLALETRLVSGVRKLRLLGH